MSSMAVFCTIELFQAHYLPVIHAITDDIYETAIITPLNCDDFFMIICERGKGIVKFS